ncbi:TPA: hypothetical protein ACSY99_09080 [Listeria monocytogenes]|uniref:hypothetical protein n=1 Tax=Listeria monocytogenes TaxID=1639 RepID=UPI0010F1C774|nr:hypothetical protein [Listeria monocytogenes]EAD0694929.1 hypothetical protein [Listeria monocytogenes]EAF0351389.1 hypothetical protein [Listeria monocytogenes]EAF2800952.1 hypothetical protein [Listeria monocytogenes]EAH4338239.1 hypothetical protein [Listeria monocytogenes]ECL1960530.1 hypothetical protein [Listeria monocytogenes]
MEKIHRGNGFAIVKNDEEYTIEWPQGPFDQVISYLITKQLAEKAMKSTQDAHEVKVYSRTGQWPVKNTEEEEREQTREFIRKFPELLIKVPDNQDLFTEEELKELLPLGKKKLSEEE